MHSESGRLNIESTQAAVAACHQEIPDQVGEELADVAKSERQSVRRTTTDIEGKDRRLLGPLRDH